MDLPLGLKDRVRASDNPRTKKKKSIHVQSAKKMFATPTRNEKRIGEGQREEKRSRRERMRESVEKRVPERKKEGEGEADSEREEEDRGERQKENRA